MLTVKKLALSTLITSSLLFYPALHSWQRRLSTW